MGTKAVKRGIETTDYSILFLSLIVFFLPLFRGLFFEKEFYIASIIISILALGINIKLFKTKDKLKIQSLIDVFAMAFVLLYVITFPFSLNKHLASFEAIKNLTYLIVFIIISTKLRASKDLSIVNWTIILSGGIVAIIGLGTALGTFNYNGAFEGGMISSTFQYHNTFGAYMLAVLFLAMGEISSSDKSSWKLILLDTLAYLLFTGFILSYSRGAWVLLPLGGALAFLLLKEKGLKKIIGHFISIILSFAVTIVFLNNSIEEKNSIKGWLFIIIGMGLCAVLSYLLDNIADKKISNIKIKRGLVILVVLILAVIVFGLIVSGVLDNILPESIISRLKSINLKTFTVAERNVFYRDALNIIKDYPVIGTGGGGWNTLYSMYKTYDYTTTQAHNYFVQTWVEAGTVGFLLLIGLFISFLLSSYRIIRYINDEEIYNKALGIICAGIVLVLHSMIDFDMSLGGYAVFVWIVYGIVSALEKEYIKKEQTILFKAPSYIFTIIILLTLIPAALFSIGQNCADNAVMNVNNNNLVSAQKNFEKAVKFSPFIPNYRFDLGNIQQVNGSQIDDEELNNRGLENMELAIKQGEYDFMLLSHGLNVYLSIGEYEKISEIGEKMLKYHPLKDDTYNSLIEAYYNVAAIYLENGQEEEAKEYFAKVINVNKIAKEKNKIMGERRDKLLKGITDAPKSYVNDRFSVNIEENILELVNLAERALASDE